MSGRLHSCDRHESDARVLQILRDVRRDDLPDRLVDPSHPGAGHPSAYPAEVAFESPQNLLRGHQTALHADPVRELRLHVATELHGRLFHDAGVPSYQRGRQGGALPQIVVVGLGDGRPEAALELGLEAHELLALALQASVVREVELDLEQADEAHSSSRSTCLVSNASMTSSSFTSA